MGRLSRPFAIVLLMFHLLLSYLLVQVWTSLPGLASGVQTKHPEIRRQLFKRGMSIEEWEDQSDDYAGEIVNQARKSVGLGLKKFTPGADDASSYSTIFGKISKENFGLSTLFIVANFLGGLIIFCIRNPQIKQARMSGTTIVYAPTIITSGSGGGGGGAPLVSDSNSREKAHEGNVAPANTLQAGAMKEKSDEADDVWSQAGSLPPPPPAYSTIGYRNHGPLRHAHSAFYSSSSM